MTIEYDEKLQKQFLRYGSLLDLAERLKISIRILTTDDQHYAEAPEGIIRQTQFLLEELKYLLDDVHRKTEDEKPPSIESRGYNRENRSFDGWSFIPKCDCDGDCNGSGNRGGCSGGCSP